MTTEAEVLAIIAQAQAIANDKQQAADGYADQAISASYGFSYGDPGSLPALVTSIAPDEYPVPTDESPGADISIFNTIKDQLIALAALQIANFLSTYFPNSCVYSTAEDWICNTIQYGGTGMTSTVEDAIWQRDRDRLSKEATRLESQVVDQWASRGFGLPAGQATAQALAIRQDYYDKVAEASRNVAIKQAEIEIENIRFAVSEALKYRIAAMNAAIDYIKGVILGASEIAYKLALDRDGQKAALISAAASYYNARTSARKLALDKATSEYQGKIQIQSQELASGPAYNQARVQAALGAATVAGQQAAAALSSINAIAQVTSSA